MVNITPPNPLKLGTDWAEFLEAAAAAAVSLLECIAHVRRMAPNAIDFTGYGDDWRDKFAQAEREHAARLGTLRTVLLEVEALGTSIMRHTDHGERN